MDDVRPRRFQVSIRTLMIVSAVLAVLLTPLAWVAQERGRMLRLQHEILAAREIALASAIREETSRQKAASEAASTTILELRRKNAELQGQVEALQREVKTLRERIRAAGLIRP